MKRLLLILLCFPLLFTTCKKEEEDNLNSPFVGYWSGTYSYDGDLVGLWSGSISSNGDINGTVLSIMGEETDLNGTVTSNGDFTATLGEIGINFIGQLISDFGSGTWNVETNVETGTWEGNKE